MVIVAVLAQLPATVTLKPARLLINDSTGPWRASGPGACNHTATEQWLQ